MVILDVAFLVEVGSIHVCDLDKRKLRGLGDACLLACSLTGAAVAEPSEEPVSADTRAGEEAESTDSEVLDESDRLRFKDPAITLDPSDASQAERLRFNNPGSILFRLDRDRDARRKDFLFQIPGIGPWYDLKDKLDENFGFRFGASFSQLYQQSSDTLPGDREDDASGYEANVHGTWTFLGHETDSPTTAGFEVLRIDRLGTDIPPAALFTQNGSLYPTAAAFGEVDTSVSELWLQQIFKKRFGFRVGKLFPITAYDFFPLKNFRLDFVDAIASQTSPSRCPTVGLGPSSCTGRNPMHIFA